MKMKSRSKISFCLVHMPFYEIFFVSFCSICFFFVPWSKLNFRVKNCEKVDFYHSTGIRSVRRLFLVDYINSFLLLKWILDIFLGNFCSLSASETRIDTSVLVFVWVVIFCAVKLMHSFPENRFVFFYKTHNKASFCRPKETVFRKSFFRAEMDQNHSFV